MPVQTSYPGVYVEELSSGVRTITGVATSVTAFVGRAKKGPANEPITIFNYGDYERTFGGLWENSPMSFSIRDFFLNGGSEAVVVRVHNGGTTAKKTIPIEDDGTQKLKVEASSIGPWALDTEIVIDYDTKKKDDGTADTSLFNMSVTSPDGITEKYHNLTFELNKPNSIDKVLAQSSQLLRVDEMPAKRPKVGTHILNTGGAEGDHIGNNELFDGTNWETDKKGIYALEKTDIFNILCIPPFVDADESDPGDEKATDVTPDLIAKATAYCEKRRAVFLVDPHSKWNTMQKAKDDLSDSSYPGTNSNYASLYFPRIMQANPLMDNQLEEFVPSGAIAGILARTDTNRGTWKAPAGTEATIAGIRGFSVPLTDMENGKLNQIGINCLRSFPVYGRVVWGARTLEGGDVLASEWKYLPVRRTALFIEESLFRGLKWVVFEPNDEPLWGQIRLNVGAFMHNLFRQGAFQGKKKEAYFVKCDSETTTQNDINNGVVNIVVGFAPLKPAEFVIIKLQQIAGQIDT